MNIGSRSGDEVILYLPYTKEIIVVSFFYEDVEYVKNMG